MKILLFCAKGFEMMEMAPFIDIFGWDRTYNNGAIEVLTCGFNKEVTSTFNVHLMVDVLIDQIKTDDYAALVIPGGFETYGFYEEAYDDKFLCLIREFNEQNKLIASVCVGALPIGKSGILKGKNATTYQLMGSNRQKQLAEFGATIINQPVVVSNNIITSWCPQTATDVAFNLLEKLRSKQDADNVRNIMGY